VQDEYQAFGGRQRIEHDERTTAMIVGVCLLGVTPASAAGGIALGSGRLGPSVAVLVGVVGGGLALARLRRLEYSAR
jgi:hypothetical protein